MKKLSVLILAILLCLCLGTTAFAEEYTVPVVTFAEADIDYVDGNDTLTLSDDLQTLYLSGQSYSRADTSILELDYSGWEFTVELTAAQKKTVKLAKAQLFSDDYVVKVNFYMTDGMIMTVNYLRDDLRAEYDRLAAGDADKWVMDFQYPNGNSVAAHEAQLTGQSTVITLEDYSRSMYYPVYAYAGGTLVMKSGALLNLDGSYFYVPYPADMVEEKYPYMLYEYLEEHPHVPALKLTDPALVEQLDAAQQAYYKDDLGFLQDDTLTEKISDVFLVLVFAIVPGAIGVLFLILALVAKKRSYKKLFWLTFALSAAELAVFIAIANMLP